MEYQDMISKIFQHLCLRTVPLAIGIIVLIGIVIYGIKEKLASKIMFFALIILIIILVVYISYSFISFHLDIHNNSYLVYDGDFEYIFRTSSYGNQVNLLDDPMIKLRSKYFDLEAGKIYTGRVVYTQRTRWVVHIEENIK